MTLVNPTTHALAALWSVLLDLVLAGMLVFLLVDRLAPPQDLPWKPFSLNQPIGLATAGKLARISADPAACRAALRAGGIDPVDQPVREEGFCSTRDTVRAQSRLSPAAPIMTCPVALGYALWERQVIEPAARQGLASPVTRVEHLGTYACRTIGGAKSGRPSQHATANALDVAGFRLADGRRITVLKDFRGDDDEARFLHTVRDGACRVFGVVLGPDYNAAHADHLHLNPAPYSLCR
ncbi:extensin family protein [Caulobacter sp.]|uniref:extensin-like domain-containing protein n=1 Tax=Caulobacter sp. TaxID=78 RepID=UPI001836B719